MDHEELLVRQLDPHDLERDAVLVWAEEDDEVLVAWAPGVQRAGTGLGDIAGAVFADPVSSRRWGKADCQVISRLCPTKLSASIDP